MPPRIGQYHLRVRNFIYIRNRRFFFFFLNSGTFFNIAKQPLIYSKQTLCSPIFQNLKAKWWQFKCGGLQREIFNRVKVSTDTQRLSCQVCLQKLEKMSKMLSAGTKFQYFVRWQVYYLTVRQSNTFQHEKHSTLKLAKLMQALTYSRFLNIKYKPNETF